MESALYDIYALVVFVSEILLVRCAHSFDNYKSEHNYSTKTLPKESMPFTVSRSKTASR